VGSLERFIGILIENHAGALPLWLAPVQAVAMNVTEHQGAYVSEVVDALKVAGIRVHADLRNEKISYKIREHSLQKVPYQLILGDKEMQARTVTARLRDGKGGGENLPPMSLEEFVSRLKDEVSAKQ
jgi:threonyl-tRNA synthetase